MAKTQGSAKRRFFRSKYHFFLLVAYLIWWGVNAINPVYPFDWFLENVLVMATLLFLWWIDPRVRFSNLSFTLIAIFLALHTHGSHYTYAEAPLGFWVSDIFDIERNHYDRIIHFCFGLLMFWPMCEITKEVVGVKSKWVAFVGLLFIISMSAAYETIEWITALLVEPDAAMAFLAAQGDLFDAQKDHALAIGGGIISFFIAKILASQNKLPPVS